MADTNFDVEAISDLRMAIGSPVQYKGVKLTAITSSISSRVAEFEQSASLGIAWLDVAPDSHVFNLDPAAFAPTTTLAAPAFGDELVWNGRTYSCAKTSFDFSGADQTSLRCFVYQDVPIQMLDVQRDYTKPNGAGQGTPATAPIPDGMGGWITPNTGVSATGVAAPTGWTSIEGSPFRARCYWQRGVNGVEQEGDDGQVNLDRSLIITFLDAPKVQINDVVVLDDGQRARITQVHALTNNLVQVMTEIGNN